jgi:hypothetical protein
MTRAALATKFRQFMKLEGSGYSPLYERLSTIIADDDRLLALLDDAPAHQRQPTLLFAALHDRVLAHPGDELARWYPTVSGGAIRADDPAAALRAFCATHAAELRTLIASRSTQTNEVLRCAALLLAVGRLDGTEPLALVDLGTSAGLNLLLDRYHYDYPGLGTVGDPASPVQLRTELRGPLRPALPKLPRIASRQGIDLKPIDAGDEAATRWLRACLFADQLDRQARLRGALEIARRDPPRIRQGNLLALLPQVAGETARDRHLCIFSTWATHYLTAEERRQFAELLQEIARSRDVTLIAAEPAGVVHGLAEPPLSADAPHATILSLIRFRAGMRTDTVLARMHSHAAWIEWLEVQR